MCGSMVDIQSPTAEIRRGNKRRKKKKPQDENIMVCPITQSDHNNNNNKVMNLIQFKINRNLCCGDRASMSTTSPAVVDELMLTFISEPVLSIFTLISALLCNKDTKYSVTSCNNGLHKHI